MKGIDISVYQGNIDFSRVKAEGIEVVYIKATQGVGYINPYLAEQYEGARANGLKIGFYHYLTHAGAVEEAQHFLSTIASYKSDCKYVIDVEGEWNISEASTTTRQFADYLISQGKEVAIYTGDYFYRDNLDNSVKDLPLWVANYGGNIMADCYVGHQYTDSGSVSGINGNVDMNEFDAGIFISNKPIVEKKEEYDMEYLISVPFKHRQDTEAAFSLSEVLRCPVMNADIPYDYSKTKTVICIGAPDILPFTSYAKIVLMGNDRWDTSDAVKTFIRNGCKL